MNAQYKVHAEGGIIRTEDVYFNTKSEAIAYMKKWFDFYRDMEADLFTCTKECGDDCTGVDTKYSIVNI